MKFPSARTVRILSVATTIPVIILGALVLTTQDAMTMIAHGPLQAGHENITCSGCHNDSPGTTRQQVQAKMHHVLGLRRTNADFGYAAVSSGQCLECHARSNERHPIYRFREPRFSQAIQSVDATNCLGCHSEHTSRRVEVGLTFCSNCHEDLRLKRDPLDISHVKLIADENWGSCLGCHDFHGNHRYSAPKLLKEATPETALRAYLHDGPSPYGETKIFEAKQK